jgi:hypothetical protein
MLSLTLCNSLRFGFLVRCGFSIGFGFSLCGSFCLLPLYFGIFSSIP